MFPAEAVLQTATSPRKLCPVVGFVEDSSLADLTDELTRDLFPKELD